MSATAIAMARLSSERAAGYGESAIHGGGYGFVLGSAVGVLVYGLIQVLIAREGLDSWWTKVFIGLVLLGFVVLQRVIAVKRE
ncbi:hypothetical protein [Schaalia hyovaginalis]|uniref:hypothetical protein n=1 Tax=Schaalia hyovaginalis TaxID=29316 RepID=UPI0018A6B068|nr:hypothetical protein [Schaalia hyovaginalis]